MTSVIKKAVIIMCVIATLAFAGVAIYADFIPGPPPRELIATSDSGQLTGFGVADKYMAFFPSLMVNTDDLTNDLLIEFVFTTPNEIISSSYTISPTRLYINLPEVTQQAGDRLDYFIRVSQGGQPVRTSVSLYGFAFDINGSDSVYDEGYNDGYTQGTNDGFQQGYNDGIVEGQEFGEALINAPGSFFQAFVDFLDSFLDIGVGALTLRSLCGLLFVALLVVAILKVVRG